MRGTVGYELRVCERAAGELRGEAARTGLDPAPRLSQRGELASGAMHSGALGAALAAEERACERKALKSGPASAGR